MASKGVRAFVARFITDQSEFKTDKIVTELEQAERAADELDNVSTDGVQRELDDLRRASATAAADMSNDFDRAGSEIDSDTGFRGKMGETGSEVGAEFSENIGEAFRGGDFKDTILETFTSLGPALGVAGIAVGAGAAIVNGIISGAEERKAALQEQLDELVVQWRDGLSRLNAETRRARLEAALDDPESELNQIRELVEGINGIQGLDPLESGTVEAMLFGTFSQRQKAAADYREFQVRAAKAANEATKAAYDSGALAQGGDVGLTSLSKLNRLLGEQTDLLGESKLEAEKQLDLMARLGLLSDEEVKKLDRRNNLARDLSGEAARMIERQARAADETERDADARERAADAAERTAAADERSALSRRRSVD